MKKSNYTFPSDLLLIIGFSVAVDVFAYRDYLHSVFNTSNDVFEAIGVLSGIVTLTGLFFYGRSVLLGSTKAMRATWFIWAGNGLLLLTSYRASGSDATTWVALAYAIGLLGIAFLSIKHGEGGWTHIDKICIIGAVAGSLLWWVTGMAITALVASLIIDLFGVFPTIWHSWRNPKKENRLAWGLLLVGTILSVLSMENWHYVIAAYPLQIFITTLAIFLLLFRSKPRQKITYDPLEQLSTNINTCIQEMYSIPQGKERSFVLSLPPPHIEADCCFPVFSLAQFVDEEPRSVAQKIAEFCSQKNIPFIDSISSIGPYVNLKLNREYFCKEAINYCMHHRAPTASHTGVLVEYYFPQAISSLSSDGLRTLFQGQAVGNCFTYLGTQVTHWCYFADDRISFNEAKKVHNNCRLTLSYARHEEFSLLSADVIRHALDSKIAQKIAGSKALWVDSERGDEKSFILRRHDGSITAITMYLAFLKYCTKRSSREAIISFFSCEDIDVVQQLRTAKEKFGYSIDSDVFRKNTPRDDFSLHNNPFLPEYALRYELMRVPLFVDIDYTAVHNLRTYTSLTSVIKKLKESAKRTKSLSSYYEISMMLLLFPQTVTEVTETRDPSRMCLFLEKIASKSDELDVYENKDVCDAVQYVMEKGLSLLGV
jgi:hypothetical protein